MERRDPKKPTGSKTVNPKVNQSSTSQNRRSAPSRTAGKAVPKKMQAQQSMLVNEIGLAASDSADSTANLEQSLAAGLDLCTEAVITFRHGARLDINAEDEEEIAHCGGKSEFDTPLCMLGHEQAYKTGQLLKAVVQKMKASRPVCLADS